MGKIVSNFFMSLDGVVEAPNRAFLMGRVLYDEWAAFWPSSDDEFAGFINNHPKYVVSNSIDTATWSNTTIVSGDVSQQLRELKDRTDGDLVVSGSATLVRSLLADGLVDELRLLVHPIVVGRGARLFEADTPRALELAGHEVFGTGVLNLTYTPAAG